MNIVVSLKTGGYLVNFKYHKHNDFFADTDLALITGLESYNETFYSNTKIFEIKRFGEGFKLHVLSKKELEKLKEGVKSYQKMLNKF